eukprot:CAMPEP_0118925228 /NCGR_PEP_ID=MMETSP1169-20130426/3153_1 /TAXON_ID=36882 /ORGANISM="Pyramimonas obovata, Strain CCMP722" /LENGTH=151 /DNA_ID=CAMNT_0006866469 /DNA_START=67 /DNA_END=522 /DNA_ORIENTATION=-
MESAECVSLPNIQPGQVDLSRSDSGQYNSPLKETLRLDTRVGISADVEVLYRHLLRTHLLEVYQPSVDRMQRLLSELRTNQNTVKGSLTSAQSDMQWNKNLEDALEKIQDVSFYTKKADAVTREMKSLRARMDRAMLRSQALLRESSKPAE